MALAQTDIAGIRALLRQERSVYYWLLLIRAGPGSAWHVRTLLIEAFPVPSNERTLDHGVCTYNHVVVLSGRLPGRDIANWFTAGYGEVSIGDAAYTFTLPAIVSSTMPNIQPHHVSSHLTYGVTTTPWPYTQFEIPLELRPMQRPEGPFIGTRGCPSYPTLHDLASDLVYGVKQRPSGLMQLDAQALTLRFAETEAWIDHIILGPGTLSVTVVGSAIHGVRLEVKGSPDLWFSTTLEDNIEQVDIDQQLARLDFAVPHDLPDDLWVLLSRDGAKLDEHWPLAERSPLGPIAHNVTVVASDSPDSGSRSKLYSPFTLTPSESEQYHREIEERAAAFSVPDEQFERYVQMFLEHYRHTLETFFPYIAPHIDMYTGYPFESLVLPLGDRGAIIGHKPSSQATVHVVHDDAEHPLASPLNIFEVAARWQTSIISFDLSAQKYDAEAAKLAGIRQALGDALEVFWRILDAATFTRLCLQLLHLEGIEIEESSSTSDDGTDAVGTVYLHEPAGYRRAEQWAFQFKHAASDERVSVSAIRQLEVQLTKRATTPAVTCFVTSGDITSIGKHVALRDDRIRVWDRPVLDRLIHLHLDAISPFFPQYADAIERLESPPATPTLDHAGVTTPDRRTHYQEELSKCPTGKKHFAQYEKIGMEIWDHLFSPTLQRTKPQAWTRDRVQRRDVLFKNRGGNRFWDRVNNKLAADFVIVDFKNYREPVDGSVIAEVSKYANDAVGRFVIVVSRKGADDGVPESQIRTFRDTHAVVIVVSDDQMLEMVERKERGEPPEDVLEDLVDTLLLYY